MKKTILILAIVFAGIGLAGCKKVTVNTQNGASGQPAESAKKIEGYFGEVLAGSSSPYLVFNKADYDKALASGKIVILDFFANWCPICRAEAPEIKAGFDGLTRADIVGFRVNYNDSDTDDDEKALAGQFGITYQHTKVILKDGKEVLKSLEQWDRNTFGQEVSKIN